ncbi:MAG: MCP four helix bundle domain-containing protein [Lachnospiraceae bacterium]|nr:MCP four helix bundle domain-containing protein [Lachnospiraceae bacterium]
MKNKSLSEKFKNWPIKTKLIGSFGLIIVTTFILIVSLLVGMKAIEGKLKDFYAGPTMNIHYSAELYWPQLDIQRAVNRLMAEGVDELDALYPQFEESINKNLEIMDDAYAHLQKTLISEENKEKLEQINTKLVNEVTGHRTEVMRLLKAGDFEAAREYNNTYYKPSVDDTKVLIEELEASIWEVAEEFENSAVTLAVVLIIIGIVLLVAITVIAVMLSLKVTKVITEPVAQLETAALQLRQGDLAHGNDLTYESEDELGVLVKTMRESINILDGYVEDIVHNFEMVADGDLTQDFNNIIDYLGDFAGIKGSFVKILKEFNSTLNQIKETSAQVDHGSDEVAAAANDLATGTGEQASAAEELSATVTTVSSMAEEAAQEAEKAYDMMMNAVHEAQDERAQMQELQEEMLRIKEISGEIEAIVTSIEEIASQTSLLSLNASIEAARAGDAGRGFAVVADQIGKLATDSARAVVNTKTLIGKTVEEIDKGNEVTGKTAEGFDRIIKEMESFAGVAKANSEVSRTQAAALQQVEEGIDQITLVTQQNAASSEECSAISEELAARAVELDNLVNRFKLH